MASFAQPARRFTFVLLEEGEDYVADWVCQCVWPAAISGNWQSLEAVSGTLRLCSKSLYFEADDIRVPIARIPFKATQDLEPVSEHAFTVSSALVVKMKANMADAPYAFEKGRLTRWQFCLTYARIADFLPLVHHYLAASRLPAAERDEVLQGLAEDRAAAAVFDTSRLVSFTEALHYNGSVLQLTPLVKAHGRLVLTSERLYFQPLVDVAGNMPVRIQPLASIAAAARRRTSLRPLGVELFFVNEGAANAGSNSWGAASAFLAFSSEAERERFLGLLMNQPALGSALSGGKPGVAASASILEAQTDWLQKVTRAWQLGRITNLDYLLVCNMASGRSFNDLTQWPVFPWVLSDYTSEKLDLDDPAAYRNLLLPMGAINADRLHVLQKRFAEMPHGEGMDRPFLYGTHYSCPGYVMFWLVRAAPGHLLRLQNGKFDAADRLFINIGDSYASATGHAADVKELIPEFFLDDTGFLVNAEQLALGTRQNGSAVGDVELPRWASDAADFLLKHRASLESSVVSANLHHWIDLIFGYKQQGQAAEEANNVFHHLTYEGAVTVADIADVRERHALEVQINEFGQCPRQIFSRAHPRRLVCPSAAEAMSIAQKAHADGQDRSRLVGSHDQSHTLALAVLKTTMASTAESCAANTQADKQVEERIQGLDFISIAGLQTKAAAAAHDFGRRSMSQQDAKEPAGPRDLRPVTTSSRISSERLKGWSNSLGSQLTAMAGALTGDRPGGDAALGLSGPQSRLRSLFQRQPGASNAEATMSSRPTLKEATGSNPTGKEAATILPAQALTERDTVAEDLASALGSPAFCSPPGTCESSLAAASCQRTLPQHPWGSALSPRLAASPRAISAFHSPITSVACSSSGGAGLVYCISQTGSLKVFSTSTCQQVRAASLSSMPLACLALCSLQSTQTFPAAITGCYDNKVYAYSAEFGRILGSFEAHDDTVSCVVLDEDCLLTASHDGCIKIWSMGEGREPWTTSQAAPVADIEVDAAVQALATTSKGGLVSATADGNIVAWDMRTHSRQWQSELVQRRISGICASPDSHSLLATTDEGFSLLDLRRSGAHAETCRTESALLCCNFDGDTAIAGAEDGQICFWDVVSKQRGTPSESLLSSLSSGTSGLNSLSVSSGREELHLITGDQEGKLRIFSCDSQ